MKRIYTKRCKIKYPHDFEDYPCKKCNGIVISVFYDKIKYKINNLWKKINEKNWLD